jgi:hypothetical protein
MPKPTRPIVLQLSHACCDKHEAVSFHHRKVQERLVALDVGQPQLVRPLRGEVALHEIVMDGRAGFAAQAAFLREMRPDPLLGAQPPHTPLRRRNAGLRLDLVRDEPIPESRFVAMDGECQRRVNIDPVSSFES